MAETKDKLVDLEDLKVLADDTTTKLGGKLAVPLNEGTQGQVLTAKGDGTSEWADAKSGSLDTKYDILTKNNVPVNRLILANTLDLTTDHSVAEIVIMEEAEYKRADAYIGTEKTVVSNFAGQGGLDSNTNNELAAGFVVGIKTTSGKWRKRAIAMRHSDASSDSDSFPLMVFDSNQNAHLLGYLEPSPDVLVPGLCKGDETTVSMQTGTGTLSVKDGGVTMAKLAQDVKDAIAGNAPTVNEADVRRIVNEQLAKMKFTINDQGHLIIETPEA